MNIIYFPLESYEERYTCQLSSRDGWMMDNFRKAGVYKVFGIYPDEEKIHSINTGQVLDGTTRGIWSCKQISYFLKDIKTIHDKIDLASPDTVLYFDDFWTPGIEAISYAYHQLGFPFPRMFSFCWAQSFDMYDFTTKMLNWIRYFEIGNAMLFEGIFVANTLLKEEMSRHIPSSKIHVVGLPFNTKDIEKIKKGRKPGCKTAVYTSRIDREKRPDRFIKIIDLFKKKHTYLYDQIDFLITTSAKELRSNDKYMRDIVLDALERHENLSVITGLSKEEYFEVLWSATAQINTAEQDWVSWTLLESSFMDCFPVYPNFRSFPETFRNSGLTLYNNEEEAADLLYKAFSLEYIPKTKMIWETHTRTVDRMVKIMKGESYEPVY